MKEILNNRYAVKDEIASFLLYTVYQGFDQNTNVPVNICVLKQNASQMKLEDKIRFKVSMQKLITFDHPHILRISDAQEEEDSLYFVTEHSDYRTIKQLIQNAAVLNISEAVEIIHQAALALDYAHQKEIYHHNINPRDIIVHNAAFKLHNFGLSFLLDYTRINDHHLLLDIFSYTSPEQVGLLRVIPDEKSDLYSLGIIFYQLLTRQLPFQAEKTEELLHQHISKTPLQLRKINPAIPEVLDEIVMKLLNKEPQQRYQSAKGLINDLDRYKHGDLEFTTGREDFSGKLTYRTRLIGREQELAALKTNFAQALAGNGKVLFIAGEAGRGKSRLIEEFSTFLLQQGVLFLEGKCFLRENKIPYQVFSDILNNYLDKIKNMTADKKIPHLSRMKDIIGELGEIILRINPQMETLIGEQKPLVPLDPEREHQRFIMVVSNFFLQLSTRDIPIVLFFDDLQWADEGTLSILEQMIAQIKTYPLFIIGGYRNNELTEQSTLVKIKNEAGTKAYPLAELILKPLNSEALNNFIAQLLLTEETTVKSLTDYIWERSQGNPFFSIEILRQFIDQKGLLYLADQKNWHIDWDRIHAIAIPVNIVDIVLKRIENLAKDQIQLLAYASCIGKEFQLEFLFRLLNLPNEKVIEIVDQALSLRLLEAGPERGTFIFVHERIKAAFSKMLTPGQNKEIHLAIAKIITELYQDKLDSFLFDLAHHYTEAGEKDKSLEYALPAAEEAKRNYANEEAINYYEIVSNILEERALAGSAPWMRVKEGLIEVYGTIGKHDEAIRLAEEILPLKQSSTEKAKIYRQMGTAYFKKGSWVECEEANARGLALLGEMIPRTKARLLFSLLREFSVHLLHCLFPRVFINRRNKPVDPKYSDIAWLNLRLLWMYILTDVGKTVRHVLRFLNQMESTLGKSIELAVASYSYGGLCIAIPLFKRAEKYFNQGVEIGQALHNPWIVAQMQQGLGFCYEWEGDCQKSLVTFMTAKDKFQKLGDVWELGMCLDGIAHNYLYLSDYQKAIQNYSEYLDISQRTNNYYGIAWGFIRLAYVNVQLGELTKAEELLNKGLPLAEEKKIWFPYCVGNIVYGYLEKEKGNYPAAVSYFNKARKLDKENTFLRNYVVYLYIYIAEVLIAQHKATRKTLSKKQHKHSLAKLGNACFKALLQTRLWANHRGGALRVYAQYFALAGKIKKADKYFIKALAYTGRLHRKYEQAICLFEYGAFLFKYKNEEEARIKWQESYKIFKEIGAKIYVERTAKLLGSTDEGESSARDRFSQERRLHALIEVSHSLSSILDIDELLEKIVDSSMKISGAERGFLLTYSGDKKLMVRVAKDLEGESVLDPELNYHKHKLSSSVIKNVIETGKSLLVNPTSNPHLLDEEEIRVYRIKSIIITPLKARNEVLGYLYLDNRLVSEAFSHEDLDLIDSLGIQATISLQNAFYLKEMVEKERLKEEILLGRQIQLNLLPEKAPTVQGLKIASFMEPASEIGGDYYDYIEIGEKKIIDSSVEAKILTHLGIVIGDVSGKGVSAGLIMSMVKMGLRSLLFQETSPKNTLLKLNNLLYQQIAGKKFISLLYLQWEADEQKMHFSSAGHEHIIIYNSTTSSVEVIRSGGVVLGVKPEIETFLEDKELKLNAGDKIILYTDGVTEARNPQEDIYTLARFTESVQKHGHKPCQELITSLKDEVYSFIGTKEQYDDITLLVMEAE